MYFCNPRQLCQGQLGSSNATLYTAPATPSTMANTPTVLLTEITVCNTDSSARTFTLYVVASGGTASAANAIFYQESIPATTSRTYTKGTVLAASGTLQGLSDAASKVTYTVSGMEVSMSPV